MSEATEFMRHYPSILMEGFRMVIGIPRRFDLRVDLDWERRHQEAGGGLRRPIGWENRSRVPVREQPSVPHKNIYVVLRQNGGESRHCISINLETRCIDESNTSMALLGRDYNGSAALGVALVTAPIVIPLLPVVLLADGAYRVQEYATGMSRHGVALYNSIKDQLDLETRELLHEALSNNWMASR